MLQRIMLLLVVALMVPRITPASSLRTGALAVSDCGKAVRHANQQSWIALAAFLVGAAPVAPIAELATKKAMTLEIAKAIAAAAERFARERKLKVNIAILDDGANLLYFQRMLGVQIGSIDVAIRKAEGAVKFRRPTKAFSDLIVSRPGVAMMPGAIAVEGGLPIVWEDEVLGAIGVSGATSEQDGEIAQAGVEALRELLTRPRASQQ